MTSKLLVIGATGTIGTHIINALAQPKTVFTRLAVFTSPETRDKKVAFLNNLRFQGVEILVGDLGNDERVKAVFEGFEVIVSALGRNALHLQPHLADLIASLPKLPSGKPRRFFPSEYGTDIKYDAKTSPHEKPHQNKLKTRAHIEALAKEGKLEFTYIVTGPFIDTFIFARAGGKACYDRSNSTFGIIGSENEESVISGTTYRDTGRYVLSSVQSMEASKNATIRVSSIDAKPSEMLVALKKIEGNDNIKARYTSLEDFKKFEQEAWEKTPESATVFTLTRIWFEGGSNFTKKPKAVYLDVESGKEVEKEELARELFKDIQKASLEDVLRPLLK